MITKEYSNGEVTILWKPEKCIHSGICVKTLPSVYHPKEKPWINPNNASSQELINQVAKCPSGALSIKKSEAMVRIEQVENNNKGRFSIYENEEFAGEMTYVWAGTSKFIIDHTLVEEKFGGKKYGHKMLMKAVEFAREKGVKILPLCPFAKAQFEKNSSIADVRY
ncbi:GNAT family N-acetyltransferase [Marinoscillum luteum]|uniref:GNAT family N-acetyltransferase n=1 Tax=Marinoscillum luteum TaxID=861051 RepID=A0ABW7NAZ9_9BACT